MYQSKLVLEVTCLFSLVLTLCVVGSQQSGSHSTQMTSLNGLNELSRLFVPMRVAYQSSTLAAPEPV